MAQRSAIMYPTSGVQHLVVSADVNASLIVTA